jgi:hypothetical protein
MLGGFEGYIFCRMKGDWEEEKEEEEECEKTARLLLCSGSKC